ncbi:hypothetical protein [Streptomyces sp. NPDC058683]|uniref:hypothetical protein n=1 Tax=Streptomyces sp. NPDC058683 TaxID=3346597 RepID=UPI00366600B1
MATTRRSAHLLGCALIAALATAGCDSAPHATTSDGRSPRAAAESLTASTANATPDPYALSVVSAPKIASDGITSLASGTSAKGNAIYEIPGGIRAGKTLAIAVNCQGAGRLTVRVQPTKASFLTLCEKGKVSPTLNEIQMSENHSSGSLSFTSEPNVKWSFAAGWDPHPPARR